MAKVNGVATQISGKVGELMFVQTKHGTIVYEAPARKKTPRRSEQQMSTRTQWANLGATYMLFDGTLKRGFEALPTNMSVYNAFVQANLGVVKVYITKAMRLNGGCVLAPYQITRGSLPSIGMSVNGSGVVVSDLALGSLQIGAQTTVGQFCQAIIANNAGWQVGDQLTFFLGRQTVNPVTNIPRATLTPNKVVMDLIDETPLWNVCGQEGFTSVQGAGGYFLGMNAVLLAGAAAWVHSREAGQGQLKVSTQLALAQPDAIMQSAFTEYATYGLINSFSERYQPQPVLTEAVKALASYQDKAKVETFLLEALKHAYNDYLIKDFINAYSLLKEGKLPDQSDNALAAAAVKLLGGNGDAICHLRACPGKLGEAATAQAGSPQPALVASISPKTGDLTVLGMRLTEVPAGTYILGHQGQTGAFNEADPAPYAKQITKVYISEQITKDAFSKFVKVYPKWAEKIEYSLESTDKEHVSNVSWYGAQAYCQYLTDQLPADLKDKYIFRLPTEYEWEAYAKDGKDSPQSLWDWCQNWYAPAEVFYSNNVPDTFPGAEKAVRGGGRQAWVRGCQSPDWVTPYIGFRVVLVEK